MNNADMTMLRIPIARLNFNSDADQPIKPLAPLLTPYVFSHVECDWEGNWVMVAAVPSNEPDSPK